MRRKVDGEDQRIEIQGAEMVMGSAGQRRKNRIRSREGEGEQYAKVRWSMEEMRRWRREILSFRAAWL